MIEAKEYFERYIACKRRDSKTNQMAYAAFSELDADSLMREADYQIPGALEELGERYLFGIGCEKNLDKALELLHQAADVGHPDAMHLLADIYRTDQHGCKDLARYFELLPAAAERGNWKSMFNLACAYYQGKLAYDGHGFNLDHAATLEWSEKCIRMTRELLTLFFTNTCTEDLRDYFGDVYDTYVRSVYASAKQYMDGDGVEKDLDHARAMVSDAQAFHQRYLSSDCNQFSYLLHKLGESTAQ
jgi:TPR repeat protein